MSVYELLKKYWGFSEFRALQEDIITSVLEGNDTLALMPTGGGKSLCFQIPGLYKEGICIVVSPLIALMKDQVANLHKKNIKAIAVYSGMSSGEIDVALDNCIYGRYKFLYCSPERLTTEIFRVRSSKMNINLIAVDEAHCISQWGYDFRPPYLKIDEFRKTLPPVPVIALTATATPAVMEDIIGKLEFTRKKVFRKSFERKNLSYSVLFEENKNDRLVKMLNKVKGSAIVYVRNRRKTKEIAEFLRKKNIAADYYHAGLEYEQRSMRQESWMKGNTRVIVCTNAFGMGIDKPDVRLVTHMDVPDDIESYFQEAGRGGRDGNKSFGVLLYSNSDIINLTDRLEHGLPTVEMLRTIYQALANYYQIAIGAGENVSFDFEISPFCKSYRINPLETLQSLKILEQEGYISVTDAVYIPSRLMITVDKETLYKFEVENKKYELLLRTLLRAYSGIFEEFININEHEIARFTESKWEHVITHLKELQHFHLLQYQPTKNAPQLLFLQARADSHVMKFDYTALKKRHNSHSFRLTAMKQYVTTACKCRSQMLLSYFGEKGAPRCGICDVCLKRNQFGLTDFEFEEITLQIKKMLSLKPCTIQELVNNNIKVKEQKTLKTIQWLLDNEQLNLNDQNEIIWNE
ncbi:MAG: RecQ family ATP-dependent DNA helicase [Chitinophagales bacterium]|nr:RecQ family ATP-dependent DNA helicase [Chitinophagales bacterium]